MSLLGGKFSKWPSGKYTARGAALAGAAKCAKKGHRGKITEGWCTRCHKWAGRIITL